MLLFQPKWLRFIASKIMLLSNVLNVDGYDKHTHIHNVSNFLWDFSLFFFFVFGKKDFGREMTKNTIPDVKWYLVKSK